MLAAAFCCFSPSFSRAVHLAFLPSTLEDIDSINLALGVESFDVASHRPHPPGYPIYIALAKASTAAVAIVVAGGTAIGGRRQASQSGA